MIPTNSCQRVRGRLDRYVDGELAALDAALDRGHLEACDACARERDRLAELLEATKLALRPSSIELERAVAGAFDHLEGAVREPSYRGWIREGVPRPIFAAAATVAAAALLLVMLQAAGLGIGRLHAPTLPDWDVSISSGADLLGGLRGVTR